MKYISLCVIAESGPIHFYSKIDEMKLVEFLRATEHKRGVWLPKLVFRDSSKPKTVTCQVTSLDDLTRKLKLLNDAPTGGLHRPTLAKYIERATYVCNAN